MKVLVSILRSRTWPVLVSLVLYSLATPANANQKTTACLNSCVAQLATCSDVCVGQFGMAAKSCRKAILKRCKKLGADTACPPDEVTTTTVPSGGSATTTTVRGSPVTTTTLATSNCSGTFCDLGDGTVLDSATGLQWEKKTTEVGSGVNPADLHDVDNHYAWSGSCSIHVKYCQPNQAAEDTCDANSSPADRIKGCQQCVASAGDGTCAVEPSSSVEKNPITTVWDWLNQLNASNFAGHNDWRLPNEAGCNTGMDVTRNCSAFGPHELETILRGVGQTACKPYPCIDDIFGPTAVGSILTYYMTGTSDAGVGLPYAWAINFFDGTAYSLYKFDDGYLRAVRTAQ
jgi:Protein of unknown function (DUF1566)